jgi:hypothetical protein
VISQPLLTELALVMMRPRFARKYGITSAAVAELIALLRERAELVPVSGRPQLVQFFIRLSFFNLQIY